MFKLEQRNANMFTKVVVTGWVWKNAVLSEIPVIHMWLGLRGWMAAGGGGHRLVRRLPVHESQHRVAAIQRLVNLVRSTLPARRRVPAPDTTVVQVRFGQPHVARSQGP